MPKPTRSAGTPCHRKRPAPLTRPVTVLFQAKVEPHSCLNPWSRRGRAGRRCLRSGFRASLDGGALTAPDESARFAEQAVRGALADAGLEPHAVDWVSAHGTGTPLNDRSEAVLLERVFAQAEARPAVTALKSWIGHGSAACGGMELALMLAAWRSGRLPPIRNLRAPCSGLLDFAVATRPFPGPVGVLENFGFGGQNAALVVRCGDD